MNLDNLFDILSTPEFQNPDSGSLFFPVYVYTYNPAEEYQFREQLEILKDRLLRAAIYQDCMVINIYDVFIDFLKSNFLGEDSLFDLLVNQEQLEGTDSIYEPTYDCAVGSDFFDFLNNKIINSFNLQNEYKKVYIFIHGFGSIFPFLRLSEFIKLYEKYIDVGNYKIISFYPGKFENNHYYLFNELINKDFYRAILLNSN